MGGSLANVVTRWAVFLIAALALAVLAHHAAHAQAKKSKAPAATQKTKAPPPKQSSMIIDGNTGNVLHNDAGDELRYPASLTKIMTLYMVFSEIEAGRLSLSSRITLSARAAGQPPSKLDIKAGETITVKDAIRALVVRSANDIAVAVAEHIGGNEPAFARQMTQTARRIGMSSTTFFNASGLPDDRQKTTARDMLTLALRIQDDFPQHYHHFSATSFTHGAKTWRSHNTLMSTFPGMDGMKTGYIRASGFNLVSSVRTGNKHIVGVVFGGKTAKVRNAHMQTILFQSLERASTRRTRSGSQPPMIARQRQQAPQQVAAAAPPPAPRMAAASIPMPVRAVRPAIGRAPPQPAPATRAPDRIAQVLEEGDTSDQHGGEDAAEFASPRLDLMALRAAMSDADTAGAPAAAPPPPAYASGASGAKDIASLIRNSLVDGAPAPRRAAPPQQTSDGVARQPSSLNAQAQALGMEVAALPHQNMAARGSPSGGFDVQIGAYVSAEEAERRLQDVRSRAGALLSGYSGAAIPVQTDERQIYRARFVNFEERAAMSACLELRRMAIDCLVMRAE